METADDVAVWAERLERCEPTYEGWKLGWWLGYRWREESCEPTYEGWKPVLIGWALLASAALRAYL